MQDIHIHICQSYPLYILYILFCPGSISSNNIPIHIQLGYPDYIQIYPFESIIDTCIRYPWCYPILLP